MAILDRDFLPHRLGKERNRSSKVLVFAIILIAVLILGAIAGLIGQIGNSKEPLSPETPVRVLARIAYTMHSPISITAYGFTNESGVVWGSGTESDPYVIEGWDISSALSNGIQINVAESYFVIRDCYVHGEGSDYTAIHIMSCWHATISNCTCSGSGRGIHLDWSGTNNVTNNTCFSNKWYGIECEYSGHSSVTSNNCSDNGYGIFLSSSDNSCVINNTVSSNQEGGIYLSSCVNATLRENEFVDDGITLDGDELRHFNTHSIDATNSANTRPIYYYKNLSGIAVPAGAGQVLVANCSDMLVEDQNLSDTDVGIELAFCTRTNVTNNNCSSNNWLGAYVYSSNGNRLIDNTFSSEGKASKYMGGVTLYFSDNNSLAHNTCFSNNGDGIALYYSNGSNLDSNNCSNNVVGIRVSTSDCNILVNNTCSNGDFGIFLTGSANNSMDRNECLWNGGCGIFVTSSDGNSLTNNDCSGNYCGISLEDSGNNTVTDNNCSLNRGDGIKFGGSNTNTILSNWIEDNTGFGIAIWSCIDNRIWNNTFIGNNGAGGTYDPSHIQARDDCSGNWWNNTNGYGNYWSDWTTPDVAPPDGIVDVPYDIAGSAGAKDYYPLTTPQAPIPEFGMMPFVVMVFLAAALLTREARRRKAHSS